MDDSVLGRFAQPDTIVPNPGDPQALNRYSYTLNNPVRYSDPTGMFNKDEIEQYLQDHYGDSWQDYWDAWQADPLWWWILSQAQNGDILSILDTAGQTWQMSFEASGSSFGLFASGQEHPLHWWQGTGYMELSRPFSRITYSGLDIGATAGLLSATATAGDVWSPIYDYSSGIPVFGGEWNHISAVYNVSRWTPLGALARPFQSKSIPFSWLPVWAAKRIAPTLVPIAGQAALVYTAVESFNALAVTKTQLLIEKGPLSLPLNYNPNGGMMRP